MQLSKSDYMLFLKHPAWLWLKKYNKAKLPPIDAETQLRFDGGNAFEDTVEAMYPNGISLGFKNYNEYLSLPERTSAAISSGAMTIFQGRFEADNLTCIVDVLNRFPETMTFELMEVKSSTKVWPEHIADITFQYVVVNDAAIPVSKITIAHASSKSSESPVTFVDVTKEARKALPETRRNIEKALRIIDSKEMPDPDPKFASPMALKDWLPIYESLKI